VSNNNYKPNAAPKFKGKEIDCRELLKDEAVAFAEWAGKNGWNYALGKWNDKPFLGGGQNLTTEQLYHVYKNPNNGL
jgi:hypothetical protein